MFNNHEGNMGTGILKLAIYYGVEALIWIIIIDAVLTFIPSIDRRNPAVLLLRSITEPIYAQVRKVIPTMRVGDAGLDLSPLIVIFGLQILRAILFKIL